MKKYCYTSMFFLLLSYSVSGCASIPPAAPQLSLELGNRISRIEDANIALLHRFFAQKRAAVDQFIQAEWVPLFAAKVFSNPKIARAWNTIVSENNEKDRLKFLILIGPKLQDKINNKRLELIQPLDNLQREIESAIRNEFRQVHAMNNSITSFLLSASKVSENQQRYLEKAGLSDEKVGKLISKTDDAVSKLLKGVKKLPDAAEKYKESIQKIREKL